MTETTSADDDTIEMMQHVSPEHRDKLKALTKHFEAKSQGAMMRAIIEGDGSVTAALDEFEQATANYEKALEFADVTPQRRAAAQKAGKTEPDVVLEIVHVTAAKLADDILAALPADRFISKDELCIRMGYEPYPSNRFYQATVKLDSDPNGPKYETQGQRRGKTYRAIS